MDSPRKSSAPIRENNGLKFIKIAEREGPIFPTAKLYTKLPNAVATTAETKNKSHNFHE